MRQRGKEEDSGFASGVTWLNPEGWRGWSEVLVAMFWVGEMQGESEWRNELEQLFEEEHLFSTGRKYRRRPLTALVHGNRKGLAFGFRLGQKAILIFNHQHPFSPFLSAFLICAPQSSFILCQKGIISNKNDT